MPPTIQDAASRILKLLVRIRKETQTAGGVDGQTLLELTSLPPNDLNDAVSLLQQAGYVEWRQYLGTSPFVFGTVWATPVGRYEAERINTIGTEPLKIDSFLRPDVAIQEGKISFPPTPIGSPFGFKDEDWEFIAEQKDRAGQLYVVMGYQFESTHYDSTSLKNNVRTMFRRAVSRYNELPGSIKTSLEFRPLAAGYGEHLFNEIARDIIASDIAVFDTSDLNPNVMVEIGVALTWGVRVLPIKLHTQPNPPSDISGQTWVMYEDSGAKFLDDGHEDKLVRMVERAVRKKGRSS